MSNLAVALDWHGTYHDAHAMHLVGLTKQAVLGANIQAYLEPAAWLELVDALQKGRTVTRKQRYTTPIGVTEQDVYWEVVYDQKTAQSRLVGTVHGIKLLTPEVSEITCTCEDSADTNQKLGHNGLDKPSVFPEMTSTFFLESLDRWLSQLSPTPMPRISANGLFVDCRNHDQVDQLLRTAAWLKGSEIELIFFTVQGAYLGHVTTAKLKAQSVVNPMPSTTLKASDMLSSYARTHQAVFDSEPGITFIHSADRDSGYRILAARSEITEARLNQPIAKLLGQPLTCVDSQIAVTAQQVIEAAIADPSQMHYGYYEYQDPPGGSGFCALWRFQVSAIYLPEYGEVLRKTIDNPHDPRASWQEAAWRYGQKSGVLINA